MESYPKENAVGKIVREKIDSSTIVRQLQEQLLMQLKEYFIFLMGECILLRSNNE
jgi:hypothetical protein